MTKILEQDGIPGDPWPAGAFDAGCISLSERRMGHSWEPLTTLLALSYGQRHEDGELLVFYGDSPFKHLPEFSEDRWWFL